MAVAIRWIAVTALLAVPLAPCRAAVPIILDTDIGTDVDDAYALVLAATSDQLDLRAVTTVNAKVAVRSAIARKLLLLLGRPDVPVASGRSEPRDGHKHFWGGWEGKGLLVEGETVGGISDRSAIELMSEVLQASKQKVVIVSVGGLSNVADLLQTRADLIPKIERLVIMGGCVRPLMVEEKQLPERLETNLHNDVDAAAEVLRSGLPITLVPAEVTFRTKLLKPDYARIEASLSPPAAALRAMTGMWEPLMKGFMKDLGVERYYDDGPVMLHDPLAVYWLIEPQALTTERATIRLEVGPGTIRTVADPQGPISIDLVTAADNVRLSHAVAAAVLPRRVDSFRYLRRDGGRWTPEALVSIHHDRAGWSIVSRTERGRGRMAVMTRYDADGRLTAAEASMSGNGETRTAVVDRPAGQALVQRPGQDSQAIEVSAEPIVTSAPDWSDALLLCRRFQRDGPDQQTFDGLWIHPIEAPMRLKFAIRREGSAAIERDGKHLQLGRFTLELRGGSRYAAWADPGGTLIKLVGLPPLANDAGAIVLQGFEDAASALVP